MTALLGVCAMQSYTRWMRKHFWAERVGTHIVITGHFNATTARTFIAEFFHPDRGYQVSRCSSGEHVCKWGRNFLRKDADGACTAGHARSDLADWCGLCRTWRWYCWHLISLRLTYKPCWATSRGTSA